MASVSKFSVLVLNFHKNLEVHKFKTQTIASSKTDWTFGSVQLISIATTL